MPHFLPFFLTASILLFNCHGSSVIVPEDNLASTGTTANIDNDSAIDASTVSIEDSSFAYRILRLADSLYLPMGYEDDLSTGFQGEVIALELTSGSAAFQQVVSNSLHRLLDRPEGGPANEAFYHRYLKQRKKAYRNEMKPQIGSDGVDYSDFKFREEVTMEAVFNKSELFTLSIYCYFYRGGAYGAYGTHLRSFTDNPARQINRKDIFAPGTDEQLGEMLFRHAEPGRNYNTKAPTPVTDNFGITDEGLEFIFIAYETSRYRNFQTNITLTWDVLLNSDLLTSYGRGLIERLR